MDSSLVRKMEKAKDYSVQNGRVTLTRCQAKFRGDNADHEVTYDSGNWSCTCYYFITRGVCVHIMAMRMMLSNMVTDASETAAASPA